MIDVHDVLNDYTVVLGLRYQVNPDNVIFWISIKYGPLSLVKLRLVKVFSFLELINQKIPPEDSPYTR